jgi:uncharacterized protein (DUF2252 family)
MAVPPPSDEQAKRTTEILDVFDKTFGSLMTGDPTAFQSKFRKMAATPFAFFRGSACLFYHDLRDEAKEGAYLNDKTSRIWIHGDLHAENFGTYMNAHGRLIFNVNDFDEAYVGPFIWDLKRFSASIALIGYGKALSDEQISQLVKTFATSYARQIRTLAPLSESVAGFTLDTSKGPLLDALRSARLQSRVGLLDSNTHIHGHERHFTRGDDVDEVEGEVRKTVVEAFKRYLETLPNPKRRDGSCIKDNLLVAGENEALDGDVVVYMKQSQPSAVSTQLQDAKAKAYFKNDGHRTVTSQRALQAHADPWLGWTEIDGIGYMVSEVSPFAIDIEWAEINDPEQIEAVVGNLGEAVAIMHAAADDESVESLVPFSTEKAIAEAIGDDDAGFEKYLTDFAHQYSAVARRDHQLFIDAFRNGQIPGMSK